MTTRGDKAKLKKALRVLGASEWHWIAAFTLYKLNGFDNAMEYVERLRRQRKELRQMRMKL